MILHYKKFSYLVFYFLIFGNLIGTPSEQNLAEEGSRYYGNLEVDLVFNKQKIKYNFFDEHKDMASIIKSDADEGQYSSIIRFHPIIINAKGEPYVGQTVYLASPDCLSLKPYQPHYEVCFASGLYNINSQEHSMKYNSTYDLVLSESVSKIKLMTLRPALHKTKKEICVNKFPIRFMMFNYVDPGLLKQQLQHRYVDINESIMNNNKNVSDITEPHEVTIKAIDERSKKITDIFSRMGISAQENATDVVLESYRQELESTRTPNSNSKTNSYNCAEQCQLTYLQDQRVKDYLNQRLNVKDNNFLGLIVSIHCSHTPCHSCTTAFTREAEKNGVFSILANNKPVHILCSCQWHYPRPKEMLPYDKTYFLEIIKNKPFILQSYTAQFDADFKRRPYPVVLLQSNPDDTWSINFEQYDNIIKEQSSKKK